MNKPFFKFIIFFVIIFSITVLFIKNTSKEKGNPWHALPNSPAIIIEIDNTSNFLNLLNNNSKIISGLKNISFFNELKTKNLDILSLFKNCNKQSDFLKNSKILIGIYKETSVKKLFVIATEKAYSINKINKFLKTKLGNNYSLSSNNNSILLVKNLKTGKTLIIGFSDNLLIVSEDKTLVNKGLKTYNNSLTTIFSDKKTFSEIQKAAGKKINLKIFYNNKNLKNLLKPIISKNYVNEINVTESLSKYTETDVIFKDDEIIFNGMAIGDTSEKVYQDFIKQKPQPITLTGLMPFNTNLFIHQGFSDFTKWVENKNTNCGIVNTKRLIPIIDNEIAFINTATSEKDFYKKSFFIAKIKNKEDAIEVINKSVVNNNAGRFENYVIKKLKSGALIEKLFGKAYSVVTENYFVFVDDNLIFANNQAELKNLLMYYETGKTLDLNVNFKTFSKNLTETSNFTLFIKTSNYIDVLTGYLNKDIADKIKSNKKALSNFEAVSVQLSSQPPFIYTNMFVKYGKTQHKEELALWKVKLENEIVKKPYPVKDHTTGKYNFIVFDKTGNVYLIRTDGTILWKKKLDGLPESDVMEVDYYKNRKIQYLFNTANKLYLIDRKGRFVKGYPVNISPSASNGLSVFDYNNNKNYRILLAQSDKRIYNYTLKGDKVKGWNAFKMPDIVVKPVQHLVANNRDYIIVNDLNKNIKIVNRRGKERIKIKGNFKIADNSIFYVNKTNSKGIFITTNENGKLVYISSSGKLRYTDFGTFSKKHFFLYEDFNGDGSKDFIFVDQNKLKVFNRFKKLLFNYSFNHTITIKPSFFNIGYKNKVLGIVVSQEKTIYLFDKSGNIIISNGLVGEIPFTVVNSKNSREINLITGAGNILFNYRIK